MSINERPWRAALGWRAHSGWAVLVAIAGNAREVAAVGRWRVELAEADVGGSPQPYHLAAAAAGMAARTASAAGAHDLVARAAAGTLDLTPAERIVRRCAEAATLLAKNALGAVLGELGQQGVEVVGCGILVASGRPVPSLADALASHALIHTAEGELFRAALVAACAHHRLPATRVRERELFARAAAALALPDAELRQRSAEMGRALGPPWRQDEKHAALVGWLALAAAVPPAASPR